MQRRGASVDQDKYEERMDRSGRSPAGRSFSNRRGGHRTQCAPQEVCGRMFSIAESAMPLNWHFMRPCPLLLFLLLGASSFGQNARNDGWLQGSIKDAITGEPVVFARIAANRPDRFLDGGSDFDGFFLIRCPMNWIFLQVDAEGYEPWHMVLDLTKGWADVDVDVKLVRAGPRGQGASPQK